MLTIHVCDDSGDLSTLLDLPLMSVEIERQKSKFLFLLAKYAAMTGLMSGNPNLSLCASIRCLHFYYEHGVNSDTCLALLTYFSVQKMRGKLKMIDENANVVERLSAKFPEEAGSYHAKVQTWLHSTIYPSMRPLHKSLDELMAGYKLGLRIGDIESSSIASMSYSFAYLCCGLNLSALEFDVRSFGRGRCTPGGRSGRLAHGSGRPDYGRRGGPQRPIRP